MRYVSLLFIVSVLFSCKKKEPEVVIVDGNLGNGMLILCEGLFQQNNSSVSWVSFTSNTVSNQFFNARADRQLGDTGNDMQKYGGKIYIVVNVSSTVEVLSAIDFHSIKQIPMQVGGVAKQPRSIAFYGSNAYVTCYDGFVDVIDTTTLTVTQRIAVGSNPDGIVSDYGFLYVSNSGGLNFPLLDSTISIIDPVSNTETNKVTVGPNPGAIVSDGLGDVYVISRGDFISIPSRLVKLNTGTLQTNSFGFEVTMLASMNNYIAFSDGNTVGILDPANEVITQSNFIDMSGVTTPYGLSYSPYYNKFYVFDAMNYTNSGYVFQYSGTGTYETKYHVGLNPSKSVFIE